MRRRLSQKEQDKRDAFLVKLRKHGVSNQGIATHFGVSCSWVSHRVGELKEQDLFEAPIDK